LKLRVQDTRLALVNCTTRFPFRYGMVNLREAPQLTAQVAIEANGRTVEGYSADLLAPKWFEKDPAKSLGEDFRNLAESARLAAQAWRSRAPSTLFDLWWSVYRERVLEVPAEAPDRLVRGFGVALLERAVMDAACRAAGTNFHGALTADVFGVRPERVHPVLEGWSLAESLPREPLTSVQVRHTVGLLDPLRSDEIPEEFAVDDGMPVALDEDIEHYGLESFKIKVAGADDTASERLREVACVVRAKAGDAARFTLDGNEQIEDLGALLTVLDGIRADEDGAWFLDRLLWIEQPLHRTHSFDPVHCAPLLALSEVAPVILDEADAGTESFPRAVELGYRGVSVKNCKGVLRALLNRGLTERIDGDLFQTAEDLTNLGVLALQQDLATQASLGMTHAERNGHHYFRGLGHLPPRDRVQALEAHPALYEASGDEVRVAVRGGRLDLSDVVSAIGYGHSTTPDMAARTPLEEWSA
jgi:hypothetical protein